MTKLKGAGILGAMIIAGATLLTSFPASSASFLSIRLSHIDKACKAVPETAPICKFMARVLNKAGGLPPEQLPTKYVTQQFRAPVNKIVNSKCCDVCLDPPNCPTTCEHPCTEVGPCNKCVEAVATIENYLATNQTAQKLADTMDNACDRFSSPADAQTCRDQIGGSLPPLIDTVLANLPPITVCQGLHRRACAP